MMFGGVDMAGAKWIENSARTSATYNAVSGAPTLATVPPAASGELSRMSKLTDTALSYSEM